MKKLLIALVCILLVVGVVGGTLAWLTDTTPEVKNVFTTSDISITLTETNVDEDNTPNTNSYQMIPGWTITKDPKVTVGSGSEYCWLFVKLEESDNFDTFMEYTIDSDWTALTGVDGVYYIEVDTDEEIGKEFPVIKDNTVTVKSEVTKEQMNALTATTQPTLTVTAYATQLMKDNNTEFTVDQAWAVLNPTNP